MHKRTLAVAVLFVSLSGLVAQRAVERDEPTIGFLDKGAAAKAIVDESVEPYFTLLSPIEMTAKTGAAITGQTLDAQRDEARRRYASMTDTFTDAEQATLRWYVGHVHATLARRFPKLAADPWVFIKVTPGVEGGLPHTRGNAIVLTGPLLTFMTQSRQLDEGGALAQFAELVIHERVHVVQRLHPDVFRPLYTDVWGFEHAAAIEPNDWLTTHQVVNPDGVDVNWVMPMRGEDGAVRYVMPRIVFAGVDRPRMPVDFRLIAVTVEKTDKGFRPVVDAAGVPEHVELHKDAGYMSAIPRVQSIYHPNELAADVIARLVVANFMLPDEDLANEVRQRTNAALEREWAWMGKNLK